MFKFPHGRGGAITSGGIVETVVRLASSGARMVTGAVVAHDVGMSRGLAPRSMCALPV